MTELDFWFALVPALCFMGLATCFLDALERRKRAKRPAIKRIRYTHIRWS